MFEKIDKPTRPVKKVPSDLPQLMTVAPKRSTAAKKKHYKLECALMFDGKPIRNFPVEHAGWSAKQVAEAVEKGFSVKVAKCNQVK